MAAIDDGILMSLALGDGKYKGPKSQKAQAAAPKEEQCEETRQASETAETSGSLLDLVRVQAERDTYKALYERLLDSMTMERRIGA